MTDTSKNYSQVGALWLRKSNRGDQYYAGTIELITPAGECLEVPITIFANKGKVTDKQPHAFVFAQSFGNDEPF